MFEKLKYCWDKTNRWHRVIFINLVVTLRLFPGGQVGFYCNDPALSHSFTGETISWKWVIAVTALLPPVIMMIVERIYNANDKTKEQLKWQTLFWYKQYLYGLLLNLTIFQTVKLIVGSPRPHFFDTCQPQEALQCKGSEYVSSYTCTKGSWLIESDKSFPSGHTSLSMYAGLFLAYYLYRRTKSPNSRAILACQVLFVLSAVYCSLSRILDRRHHWWDVVAGFLLAIPILFYTIVSLCQNFEGPHEKSQQCDDFAQNNCQVNGFISTQTVEHVN